MESFFSRKETNFIKGIGILLIFLHHFFTFPGWYINGIAYPSLEKVAVVFNAPFKIPTAVFAFFTGYFYFFNKKKNFTYSLKKILKVYTVYWIIFIPLYIFAIVFHTESFAPGDFFAQLFALEKETVYFNWYVFFYAFSMLLLPFMAKYVYKRVWSLIVGGILFPVLVCAVIMGFCTNAYAGTAASYFMGFFPCITIGYLFARFKIFDKCHSFLTKKSTFFIPFIASLTGLAISMLGRNSLPSVGHMFLLYSLHGAVDYQLTMDIIYAPLFVFSMTELLRLLPEKKFFKIITVPFEQMGKYTLEMWLFSSIFFGASRDYFQMLLYFPRKAPLVLLWGCVFCYLAALAIRFIVDLTGGKYVKKNKENK